ncbi:MAG: hypothetical protein GYA50_06025 [Eubacteriaceae bacterium]|nr:hypothetical protein [Eubacteriaceae bacterium]
MDLLTKTFIVIFILLVFAVTAGIVIAKNRKIKTHQEEIHIQIIQESLFDRLINLKKQRDEGVLTQKEYEDMKNKCLGII